MAETTTGIDLIALDGMPIHAPGGRPSSDSSGTSIVWKSKNITGISFTLSNPTVEIEVCPPDCFVVHPMAE